ncbi:MAG: hypothetical protein HZB72_00595 [Burkholderiales bacterium]|nr:hypothetical protein [Burkholderiales bacterium]
MVKWIVLGAIVIAGVFWLLSKAGGDVSMGGEHGISTETHEAAPAASAASN